MKVVDRDEEEKKLPYQEDLNVPWRRKNKVNSRWDKMAINLR